MKFDELLASDWANPTVALFYGTYCAPCGLLKPKLARVCSENGIRLETFNSAIELPALKCLQLRTVPAVYSVHNGVATLAFLGDAPERDIRAMLLTAGAKARA